MSRTYYYGSSSESPNPYEDYETDVSCSSNTENSEHKQEDLLTLAKKLVLNGKSRFATEIKNLNISWVYFIYDVIIIHL